MYSFTSYQTTIANRHIYNSCREYIESKYSIYVICNEYEVTPNAPIYVYIFAFLINSIKLHSLAIFSNKYVTSA